MGRATREAGWKGQHDPDCSLGNLPWIHEEWLRFLADSWLLFILGGADLESKRVTAHAHFGGHIFLEEERTCVPSRPPLVFIYSFIEQIFIKSLVCCKYMCRAL